MAEILTIPGGRHPTTPDAWAAFLRELNLRLTRIAATQAQQSGVVQQHSTALQDLQRSQQKQLLGDEPLIDPTDDTSEADDDGSGGGTDRHRAGRIKGRNRQRHHIAKSAHSSKFRHEAAEEAASVIINALPTAAPPEVNNASAIGTTDGTSPGTLAQFALSDHTHSGVNLDQTQTITGVKTFNADVLFANGVSVFQLSTNRLGIGTITPAQSAHIVDNTGNGTPFQMDVYSATASNGPTFTTQRAKGTLAVPTQVVLNDRLLSYSIRGYFQGASSGFSGGRASWIAFAAETWTDVAQGTYMTWSTTGTGSTSNLEHMRLDSVGNLNLSLAPGAPLSVGSSLLADGLVDTGSVFVSPAPGAMSGQVPVGGQIRTGKIGSFFESQHFTSFIGAPARTRIQGTGRLIGTNRLQSISQNRNPGSLTLGNRTSRFFDRRNMFEGRARVTLQGDARLVGLGLNF